MEKKKMLSILAGALVSVCCFTACQPVIPDGDGTKGTGQVTTDAITDPGNHPEDKPQRQLRGAKKVLYDQLDTETWALLQTAAEKNEDLKKVLEDESYAILEFYTSYLPTYESISDYTERSRETKRGFYFFNSAGSQYIMHLSDEQLIFHEIKKNQQEFLQKLLTSFLVRDDGTILYKETRYPVQNILKIQSALYFVTENETYVYPLSSSNSGTKVYPEPMMRPTYESLMQRYRQEIAFLGLDYSDEELIDGFFAAQNLKYAHNIAEHTYSLQDAYRKILAGDGSATMLTETLLTAEADTSLTVGNVIFYSDGFHEIVVSYDPETKKATELLWQDLVYQCPTNAEVEAIAKGTDLQELVKKLGCPTYGSSSEKGSRVYLMYTADSGIYRIVLQKNETGHGYSVEEIIQTVSWDSGLLTE